MSDFQELNRRQLLKNVAIMTGGAISASVISGVMGGATAAQAADIENPVFTDEQFKLVSEIAEMIIPETKTGGAKAAQVPEYIHVIASDWYYDEERNHFMAGLKDFDAKCVQMNGKKFLDCNSQERTAFLTQVDNEVGASDDDKTFFEDFKELTLIGYFTSQIGAEEVLRYEVYPGPYQGCVPFEEVGRTWAL